MQIISITTIAALFVSLVAAAPTEGTIDHAALAKMFRERGLEAVEKRACDREWFDTCMGTCPVGGGCPGCTIGCTIGCCGSSGCC